MNHLNSQITTLGRSVVMDYLKAHNQPLDENDVAEVNGVRCLVVISTKRHKVLFEGCKATGINAGRLVKIEKKAEQLKCSKVYLMFVDAKLEICYAGYLHELLVPAQFDNVTWPTQVPSPGGLITYFSIYHLKTLFRLAPSTVKKLKELISDNKHDKNQGKLF